MDVKEFIDAARDTMTVRQVFGDPYERDGITFIPAADVRGGAGGGGGEDKEKLATGFGGGFGATARPAGAYVIKDGTVRWQPAIDVNRILIGAAAIASLLIIRGIFRSRS